MEWFSEFLQWLQTSKHGREEDRTKNNHATQYDAQLISYALFVEKPEIARDVAEKVGKRRINTQIQTDGSQPEEISRANGWDYSCENLRNFTRLATLARHVGVDLWTYQSKDGRSIRKAIEYLLPFVAGEAWPHKQHSELKTWRLKAALLAAPLELGCGPMAFKMLQKNNVERLLHMPPKATRKEPEPVEHVEHIVEPSAEAGPAEAGHLPADKAKADKASEKPEDKEGSADKLKDQLADEPVTKDGEHKPG